MYMIKHLHNLNSFNYINIIKIIFEKNERIKYYCALKN